MEIGWSGTVYFILWDLFSCTTFIPLTPSPQCPRLTVVLHRPFVPSPRNGFMFDQSHCFLHPLRRLCRVFGRNYLEFLWGEWRCKVHHVPPSADNQGGIGRASCLYVSYICCCWIFFFFCFFWISTICVWEDFLNILENTGFFSSWRSKTKGWVQSSAAAKKRAAEGRGWEQQERLRRRSGRAKTLRWLCWNKVFLEGSGLLERRIEGLKVQGWEILGRFGEVGIGRSCSRECPALWNVNTSDCFKE